MTRRTIAALTLAVAAALTLTACGERTGSDGSASSSPSAAFNEADVAFAQQMIPHHEQAVLMSQMAEGHARSADVRQLAAGIEAAQGPEIETMKGWLEQWGEDVPDGSTGGMDHGMQGMKGMAGMPGMMSDRQLGSLRRAHGGTWDRMFLRMMIAHHEGAIEMSRTEVADGRNDDAVALAGRIIEAQQAEIAQMREMLRS